MRRASALMGLATAASGLVLVATGAPASAAVTATSNGATVTVTVTGDETVTFSCAAGQFRVNGAATTPGITCAALGGVIVNGDAGNQTIEAETLTAAAFPNITANTFNTGAGNDAVITSRLYDTVTAGPGDDAVVVDIAGAGEPQINLGGSPSDALYLNGTAGDDQIVGSSTGSSGNVTTKVGSAADVNRGYSGASTIIATGGPGNDLLDMHSMFTPAVTLIDLDGGPGDDALLSSTQPTNLRGGPGTNTFTGGATADQIFTSSDTDIIKPGTGNNAIFDADSLRSGGRSVVNQGGTETYTTSLVKGDAVWRVRPGAAGSTKATASLNRPGIQLNPSSVDTLAASFDSGTEPADHTMADLVASADTQISVSDGTKKTAVIDITIPTGSWTTAGTIGNGSGTVDPSDPALGSINLTGVGPVSVHGPWTNQNRGFAHRVTRDLAFRFLTSAQLDTVQFVLTGGALTRPQVVEATMGTDEYRGLDVDRVFVKYLRRAADPGGRTYWVNSIRNGKALWRFRAQLFGSPEYFSKAGGTNASYVEKAYSDVLGRGPDPSGKAYWTNKLNNGADRGQVALQFINSPEARRRLVDDQYLRFLDRLPTAGEQSTWVAKIPGATGEQDLIESLAASAEYFNRN